MSKHYFTRIIHQNIKKSPKILNVESLLTDELDLRAKVPSPVESNKHSYTRRNNIVYRSNL